MLQQRFQTALLQDVLEGTLCAETVMFQNALKRGILADVFFHHFCDRRSFQQCFQTPMMQKASEVALARTAGFLQAQIWRPESRPALPSDCPQATWPLAWPCYPAEEIKGPGPWPLPLALALTWPWGPGKVYAVNEKYRFTTRFSRDSNKGRQKDLVFGP